MDNLEKTSYTALSRYFHSLSKLGYMKFSKVKKLLLLTFIDDILQGRLGQLPSEDDIRLLSKWTDCIYRTCLADYPVISGLQFLPDSTDSLLAEDEDTSFKLTEKEEQRKLN